MFSLPINHSSDCWAYHEQDPIAKDIQILTITGLAAASIFILTVGLLSHLHILTGINSIAQYSLVGSGAGLGVSALAVGICGPQLEPTKEITSPDVLKAHLKTLCSQVLNEKGDPVKALHKYAAQIPREMLQDALQIGDALQLARQMIHEADFYKEARDSLTPSVPARLAKLKNSSLTVIDSFLAALGIADFFKPSESAIHADFKFQKIMMLVSLFTLLTATLLPMLGVTAGTSVVGGCMLLIAIMSVIWPHIRPAVTTLPHSENWSEKVQSGSVWVSGARKDIVSTMITAHNAQQLVLLIGISGIGKTQTALEYTKARENSGKRVFYFNAAELASSSDMFSHQNTVLNKIEEAIGANGKDCELIIDEIHAAFEKRESNPFGDKLKTFLDKMVELGVDVTGMTTENEYKLHILIDGAADRRFGEKIYIGNTKDEETESILNYSLVRNYPDVLVEPEAMEELIKITKESPQPLTATRMLSQCAGAVAGSVMTPKALALEKKKDEIRLAASRGVVLGGKALASDSVRYSSIDQLSAGLPALEKAKDDEAEILSQLQEAKKRRLKAREAKYALIHQIQEEPSDELLNALLLIKYGLEPAIEQQEKDLAKQCDVKSSIDKDLVKSVHQKELDAKLQTALALQQRIPAIAQDRPPVKVSEPAIDGH